MSDENGEKNGPLELSDILHIATKDGAELPFEVVGLLEDPESNMAYAVLLHEPEGAEGEEAEGEFIVTDLSGNLIDDEELAQDILDDFLEFADESADAPEGSE